MIDDEVEDVSEVGKNIIKSINFYFIKGTSYSSERNGNKIKDDLTSVTNNILSVIYNL